jgi:CHAT domain-containing protein
MANPTYDTPGRSAPHHALPQTPQADASSPPLRSERSGLLNPRCRPAWGALDGTGKEADSLAPLLGVRSPQLFTGSSATAAVAQSLKAPRLLHISTHGFFLPDQPPTTSGNTVHTSSLPPANTQSTARSHNTCTDTPEDPLLRSGLVFAGANQPDANPSDDGYLTAAETTALDLQGTDLVTLSACQTALGDLRSGEGVYGLQRALTVAGSRSTLLSLWKVNDHATSAFMTAFYKRLQQGLGRADALAHTQAYFRNHSIGGYRDPYVWAAFQLTGDWRPLTTPSPYRR